ncbi:MAG: 50S ribosomal protein L33 [Candidatus Omnitrophota bacterium]
MAQEAITFECTACKNRNYYSTKNKKQNPDKIELSKFCKFCRKHTLHKEMK